MRLHGTPYRSLLRGLLLLALASCTAAPAGPATQAPAAPGAAAQAPASAPSTSAQPANVGDAKLAAIAYYESGRYDQDLAAASAEAGAWIAQRAPQASRPAIVFDIDETLLSNWAVIRADDFGRIIGGPCTALPEGPCGWAAWDLLGRSTALAPSLRLFQQARALGIAAFLITGRPEAQRAATERNLRDVGFIGYTALRMVPNGAHFASAADFKMPVRAGIEQAGYTIIANVGDQPSDLAGGHAEKAFLLPNPYYRIP